MKIKCPYCKTIYDPEVQDNTCPACNKKLLVTVFKKPAAKGEGASRSTIIKPGAKPEGASRSTVITPAVPVVLSTTNEQPSAQTAAAAPEPMAPPAPLIPPEPVAPKTVIQVVPAASTVLVEEAPPPPPVKEQVVIAPPPPVVPVTPVEPVAPPPAPPKPVVTVVPPPETKPEPAAPMKAVPSRGGTGLDLVISIQKANAANWDTVIRIPVQVLKLANLVPARAREAIKSEGIDFDELRKAVEHTDHTGPLLDLRTPTERVLIAVEPHQ